jgi:hypothetical protein
MSKVFGSPGNEGSGVDALVSAPRFAYLPFSVHPASL